MAACSDKTGSIPTSRSARQTETSSKENDVTPARIAPLQKQSQQGLSELGSAGLSGSVPHSAQQWHPPEETAATLFLVICPMQLKGQTTRDASINSTSSQARIHRL